MSKLIIPILIVFLILVIIGSENVFNFNVQGDLWILQINHQQLLTSVFDGFNIAYDFISELISGKKIESIQVVTE